MDSHALVELQRQPYKVRLEQYFSGYQEQLRQGSLVGREGNGPILPRMQYKEMFGNEYREVLNFGSNNYLGLSHHPYVRRRVVEAVEQYGVGTGGSPAFSGYSRMHRELEARLAKLAGHEDAILLPSGFMANLCWVNGLMKRQDILLYDKHSHASVIAAIKMAGIQFFPFDPDDPAEFEALTSRVIARHPPNAQIFATVEGVRSIDGAVVDLKRWLDVCRKHEVVTILDDAHGLGSIGKSGAGTLEHLGLIGEVDVRMSTCSKGLGAQGAFLSGSQKLVTVMRNHAAPYVFTTALAFPTLAAVSAALDVLEREPELVQRLHSNVKTMRDGLRAYGHRVGHSDAGIVPVYLPDGIARDFNRALFGEGLFAHVMEYPMVPPGLERLRLSMSATHSARDIQDAITIIARVSNRFGIGKHNA